MSNEFVGSRIFLPVRGRKPGDNAGFFSNSKLRDSFIEQTGQDPVKRIDESPASTQDPDRAVFTKDLQLPLYQDGKLVGNVAIAVDGECNAHGNPYLRWKITKLEVPRKVGDSYLTNVTFRQYRIGMSENGMAPLTLDQEVKFAQKADGTLSYDRAEVTVTEDSVTLLDPHTRTSSRQLYLEVTLSGAIPATSQKFDLSKALNNIYGKRAGAPRPEGICPLSTADSP